MTKKKPLKKTPVYVSCALCGTPCEVVSSDEGTHYYKPDTAQCISIGPFTIRTTADFAKIRIDDFAEGEGGEFSTYDLMKTLARFFKDNF